MRPKRKALKKQQHPLSKARTTPIFLWRFCPKNVPENSRLPNICAACAGLKYLQNQTFFDISGNFAPLLQSATSLFASSTLRNVHGLHNKSRVLQSAKKLSPGPRKVFACKMCSARVVDRWRHFRRVHQEGNVNL